MHVALRGRDPRVPEELLDEVRVGVPGHKAAGGVAEGMEAQRSQTGGITRRLETAANRGGIEAPAEARAEDVVLTGRVVAARPQAFKCLSGGIGERREARLPESPKRQPGMLARIVDLIGTSVVSV